MCSSDLVRGMAGDSPLMVARINPADRSAYHRLLEETILRDGVKVLIADKECGITFHRARAREERAEVRRHGYLPRKKHMNVTPEVCEFCLECTKATACPGLTVVETDYGRKIDTDLTWCVNDGACERVRVSNDFGKNVKPCPSFEEVTVIRRRRRRYTLPNMRLDKLPEPTHVHDLVNGERSWRVHLAGVGGMGIGVVGQILVRAGHEEGLRVVFCDKNGLAIRNGGVYSQITFVADDPQKPDLALAASGLIPYGKADLLLGVDVLEAARAVDPRNVFRICSPRRTAAVLNLYKQPTVQTLLGSSDFDPARLRDEIETHCRPDRFYARDLSEMCEQRLGSKQYVNLMMLGVAFQLGLIPVSAKSMLWAIRDTIKRDQTRNIKAFNIGRRLALEPRAIPPRPEPRTWEQLITSKVRILKRTRMFGGRWAERFEQVVRSAVAAMPALSEDLKYDLALRIYDLIQYEDDRLARRYVQWVLGIYQADSADRGYAATAAAVWNAAKVMLIKDEPYVAYLLTRHEKRQRDIIKYGIDAANGDRIAYRFHNQPEIVVGPLRLRLKLKLRPWHLAIARNMRFLRKLPGWHRREAAFRDWYLSLPARLDFSQRGYEKALAALRAPEQVSGYREVRYPKQERVMAEVEAELARKDPQIEVSVSRLGLIEAVRRPAGV